MDTSLAENGLGFEGFYAIDAGAGRDKSATKPHLCAALKESTKQ